MTSILDPMKINPPQNFSLNLKFKWTITGQYNFEEHFFAGIPWTTLLSETQIFFFFFVDLKNSTYLFQAQHIKYRKDTLPRTKVLSWWIRCYSTSMVIAALTQFSIFTGLKCFSKPVTDKLVFSTEEVSPSLIHSPKGPTNE